MKKVKLGSQVVIETFDVVEAAHFGKSLNRFGAGDQVVDVARVNSRHCIFNVLRDTGLVLVAKNKGENTSLIIDTGLHGINDAGEGEGQCFKVKFETDVEFGHLESSDHKYNPNDLRLRVIVDSVSL